MTAGFFAPLLPILVARFAFISRTVERRASFQGRPNRPRDELIIQHPAIILKTKLPALLDRFPSNR